MKRGLRRPPGARREHLPKRQQGVLVAAGAVQQQERRSAGLGGRLEAVDEREFGRGGHGYLDQGVVSPAMRNGKGPSRRTGAGGWVG